MTYSPSGCVHTGKILPAFTLNTLQKTYQSTFGYISTNMYATFSATKLMTCRLGHPHWYSGDVTVITVLLVCVCVCLPTYLHPILIRPYQGCHHISNFREIGKDSGLLATFPHFTGEDLKEEFYLTFVSITYSGPTVTWRTQSLVIKALLHLRRGRVWWFAQIQLFL